MDQGICLLAKVKSSSGFKSRKFNSLFSQITIQIPESRRAFLFSPLICLVLFFVVVFCSVVPFILLQGSKVNHVWVSTNLMNDENERRRQRKKMGARRGINRDINRDMKVNPDILWRS